MRLAPLAGILALAGSLTGCGGSNNALGPIGSFGPGGNNAQVRFVNGSPDAGPVQIFIDNAQQFCQSGTTGSACSVSYGQITSFAVNVSAGQHTVVFKDKSGSQISIPSGALSVNSGFHYSLVLTGELHPASGGAAKLGLSTFTDEPFSTPGGGAAVNVRYASPYMAATNSSPLQFGYFLNNNPSTTGTIGTTDAFGSETTPQGLPSSALSVPITFFAGSATGPTVTPSQIDSTKCSANTMPCSTGNLSLYLIDGPASSSSPVGTPPAGISSSARAGFVGVFD